MNQERHQRLGKEEEEGGGVPSVLTAGFRAVWTSLVARSPISGAPDTALGSGAESSCVCVWVGWFPRRDFIRTSLPTSPALPHPGAEVIPNSSLIPEHSEPASSCEQPNTHKILPQTGHGAGAALPHLQGRGKGGRFRMRI